MIKLKDIINEAPIDTYSTIGDFSKNSSFNKTDRTLITHPTSIQRVKDFFKCPNTTFDFYFVNTKEARKYTELGEIKEDFLWDELKITPEQLKDGKINYNNITVFFTNNKGDERMPLTPWVMAHRFGHVLRRSHAWQQELSPWVDNMLNGILGDYGIGKPSAYSDYKTVKQPFELAKRYLCQTIGTFKSARDKNLRNAGEFQYELFAQYIKNGEVKFNPIPPQMAVGLYGFGRKKYATYKGNSEYEYLHELQNDYSYYADSALTEAEGKIWLM